MEIINNIEGLDYQYNKREFIGAIKNLEIGQSLKISIEELKGADPHYAVVILWRMGRKLHQKKLKDNGGYVYTRVT